MADKQINIEAKIANLQQIKQQLASLKVDVSIDSKELKRLSEMASKGLKIDVKLNIIGNELKQLLDLQRKGIQINVGGAKPLTGGNTRLVTDEDLFKFSGASSVFKQTFFGNKPDKIQQFFAKQEQEERQLEAALQREAETKRRIFLNKQKQINAANRRIEESPFDFLIPGGGQRKIFDEANRIGVNPGSLRQSANFFKPSRILERRNAEEILFTTLLGGKAQGLGAAVGTATLGGGVGTLLGATVAADVVNVFQDIGRALKAAAEAGIEYERSVTGITGILQATTEITGPGGTALPIRQQLAVQGQRASGIQAAAQRALLPLGISGATGAALTQSFTAGLAQRGLVANEGDTETLLRRFGAAIQTLQPELAQDPTLIRRGFEDIIGGGPQASRTELGSAIRGVAPGLFGGNIRTVEDIKKATESLEKMAEAIRNSDKATIQLTRAQAFFEAATQRLGRGLLEGLAPGFKAFADALEKTDFLDQIQELGAAFGEAGSALITDLLPALGKLTGLSKASAGGAANLIRSGVAGTQAVGSALTGDFFGAKQGLNDLFSIDAPTGGFNTAGFRKRLGLGPETETRQSIQTLINRAVREGGISSPEEFANAGIRSSANNRLRVLGGLRNTLNSRSLEINPVDAANQRIGIGLQELNALKQREQEGSALFGTGDKAQLSRALFEKGEGRAQLDKAEEILRERQRVLERELKSSTKSDESIAQAREGARQAEEEVTAQRLKNAETEKKVNESRDALLQKEIDNIDKFSFKGQEEASAATKTRLFNRGIDLDQEIATQRAFIASGKGTPAQIRNAQDIIADREQAKGALQPLIGANLREDQLRPVNKVEARLEGIRRQESAADTLKESALALRELGISTKELTLKQNELSRSLQEGKDALSDFNAESRLRGLGREGQLIAGAEKIVAAGGAVPAGISESLVRGAPGFDESARQEFERQLAEEEFSQTSRQIGRGFAADARQEGRLRDRLTQSGLDYEQIGIDRERQDLAKEKLPRGARDAEFALIQENIKQAQLFPEDAELQKKAQEGLKRLPDLLKPLSTEGSGAPPARKSKPGTFSIDGESISNPLSGTSNISSLLEGSNLIASNDIGASILSAISGGKFVSGGKTSEKGAAAAGDILKGLIKDRSDTEGRDVNGGASIFDKLEAALPPPLSKQDMTEAFAQALNQQFV